MLLRSLQKGRREKGWLVTKKDAQKRMHGPHFPASLVTSQTDCQTGNGSGPGSISFRDF